MDDKGIAHALFATMHLNVMRAVPHQEITMLRINRKFFVLISTVYIAVGLVHVLVVRPAYLEWGAILPGDSEVPANIETSTRAITINAPAAEIWQWIVQIGQDRGGWYSFYWLENLFAANMHNTDRIVADWQTLNVGDQLPFLEGGTGTHSTQRSPGLIPNGHWCWKAGRFISFRLMQSIPDL